MKKEILIALLCAGLMLVAPFTVVAQENTVSNNLPEQPNDVEGLVAQIKTVIDEILQRYGHIPIVRSLCNVIFNILDSFGLVLFCLFLEIILWPLVIIDTILFGVIGELPYYLTLMCFLIAWIIDTECPDPFKQSFQSIYTMLETKDNINTFDCCPCLQE